MTFLLIVLCFRKIETLRANSEGDENDFSHDSNKMLIFKVTVRA